MSAMYVCMYVCNVCNVCNVCSLPMLFVAVPFTILLRLDERKLPHVARDVVDELDSEADGH